MGLLEKSRYYKMGFKEKAQYWLKKWGMPETFDDHFQEEIKQEQKGKEFLPSIEEKSFDIKSLLEISKELHSSIISEDLYHIIFLVCMGQFGVSNVSIFVKSGEFYNFARQRGLDENDFSSLVIPFDSNLIKFFYEKNKPIEFNGLENMQDADILLPLFEKLSASLIAPLFSKNSLSGLLILGKKINNEDFIAEEIDFLMNFCVMAGIALENAIRFSDMKKSISGWSKTLEKISGEMQQ